MKIMSNVNRIDDRYQYSGYQKKTVIFSAKISRQNLLKISKNAGEILDYSKTGIEVDKLGIDSVGVDSKATLYRLNDDLQFVDSCVIRDIYFKGPIYYTPVKNQYYIRRDPSSFDMILIF